MAIKSVIYAKAFPDCQAYLYITLGMGDYFHPPYEPRFRWVRLHQFADALNTISTTERVIEDWKNSVNNELDMHNRVGRNDQTLVEHYRAGAWNIYFLGQLNDALLETGEFETVDIDPTCYTWGRRSAVQSCTRANNT